MRVEPTMMAAKWLHKWIPFCTILYQLIPMVAKWLPLSRIFGHFRPAPLVKLVFLALPGGVIGNTLDSGSRKSRFES